MGNIYDMYGGKKKYIQGFCGESLGQETTSNTQTYGRIILKWISDKWDGGMDWINLAEDRDRWCQIVNVVTNLRIPYNSRNFLTN